MVDLLITIFLGPFGIHKFKQRKIGIGILYLCTLGLFGIGWIYDVVLAFRKMNRSETGLKPGKECKISNDSLLRWQRLVTNINAPRLMVNRQQLTDASQLFIENNTRILTDSMRLIHETTNPEVYFKRVDIALECLNNLADLEEFYATGMDPITQLQNFDESTLLHDFIQRYWFRVCDSAEKLKTEKAKENRKSKAKSELYIFSEKIDAINLEYIQQLI